jgi:hypothetical protein
LNLEWGTTGYKRLRDRLQRLDIREAPSIPTEICLFLFDSSSRMALYSLAGSSKDSVDELKGFISGKEPFEYQPRPG